MQDQQFCCSCSSWSPTLPWVGLGLEALICLLSTCSTYSNLNLSSPVACPCRAVSNPLQYIGFLCPFSQNPIHTVPPLGSFLIIFLIISLVILGHGRLIYTLGICEGFVS